MGLSVSSTHHFFLKHTNKHTYNYG
jgi:hypothetical protein